MSTPHLQTIALVSALTAVGCAAEPPQNEVTADLVIHAGQLIVGDGVVLDDVSVVVTDGRIQQVQQGPSDVAASVVIDVPEHTLMPGLIQTHAHLLTGGFTNISDSAEAMDRYRADVLPGILEGYVSAGFTTVMDAGGYWPAIADVRADVAAGRLRGPRILTLGPAFTAPGGHPATTALRNNPWGRAMATREVDDESEARAMVDALAEGRPDGIKAIYSSFPGNGPKLRLDVLRAVASQAERHEIQAFAHTNEVTDTVEAVQAGVTRLVHSPWGSTAQLIQLLRERDVVVATTLGGNSPEGHFTLNLPSTEATPRFLTRQAAVGELARAGVPLAYGTDSINAFSPARELEIELDVLRQAGLTEEQLVTALTRTAAAFIYRDMNVGTVEAGKLADLLIIDGNPLEDVSALQNVTVVLKEGEVLLDNRK
jgi:imidazolonepropionase-like amidohydrolase